jgi:DNA polymerase I
MLVQIIDVDYFLRDNKTVVRLFGKKENGAPVCAFFEGFQPYFYVEPRPGVVELLQEMHLSFEEVKRKPAIGWSKEPTTFLKVTLSNPQDVPRVRSVLEQTAKCYEADVLFKYRFLVDHGLHGMGWAEIEGDPIKTASAKVQAIRARGIRPAEKKDNTPLRYLCIDIECLPMDYKRAMDAARDPTIAIALTFLPSFGSDNSLVLLAKPTNGIPGTKSFANEKEMLEAFAKIVREYDPDVVTGFNINGFDIPYLLTRMKKLGVQTDLGRTDKQLWASWPPKTNEREVALPGRVVADVFQIVKWDVSVRFVRYNLDTVAREMLGEEKGDVKHTEMQKVWASEVPRLVEYARKDAVLALRLLIEKRMLDRFVEISKISGVLLQDCLGGQSQRIETMVMHEFRKRGMIMPPKPSQAETERRAENKIKGAIVLEPKKGLHTDSVLVLDFQSLYPNIIRTFNVSPDTLLAAEDDAPCSTAPNGARFVDKSVYEGVLPSVIKGLLDARKATKRAMKDAETESERRILDAQQHGMKILANSIYGYTGYARARLFVGDVANAITAYGRDNIVRTKELVEDAFGHEVIYSDTDSLFVKIDDADVERAWQLGERMAKFISEKTGLQMEFEKIYKTFLILTKKRYAGLKLEKTHGGWKEGLDMRGIETVRRDWCPLVGQTLLEVLRILLKDRNIDAAKTLIREVAGRLSAGEMPLEKLTIVKGITRGLDSYAGMQPHIELARKMVKRNPAAGPKVGDRLSFVIVRGKELLSKRAEDPEYVQKYNIPLDVDYYMTTQLMPPVMRVLEAVGVQQSEVAAVGAARQTSLFDAMGSGQLCRECGKAYRRLPLTGKCECGQLLAMLA